jgi:hypothetical protein
MPAGDGTGPVGLGPMTGRAAGYCAGYRVPGFMNPVPGRGFWGRPRSLYSGPVGAYGAGAYAAPNGYSVVPYAPGPRFGWGLGRGRGWGRGFGRSRGRRWGFGPYGW